MITANYFLQQPTGGPLLLQDTQPDEEKALIEEKLKKVKTEKAPVAGQRGAGAGGSSGIPDFRRDPHGAIEALRNASRGGDLNNINDMASLFSGGRGGAGAFGDEDAAAAGSGSGAAAAAGVLTAVDEDNEGDEEAPVPEEFDYFTDNEGGEGDDDDVE